jgi:hypothetical protein
MIYKCFLELASNLVGSATQWCPHDRVIHAVIHENNESVKNEAFSVDTLPYSSDHVLYVILVVTS